MFYLKNRVHYLALKIITIMLIMLFHKPNSVSHTRLFCQQSNLFKNWLIPCIYFHLLSNLLDEFYSLNFLRVVRIEYLDFVFCVQEKELDYFFRPVVFIKHIEVNPLYLDIWIPNFLETVRVLVFFCLNIFAINFDDDGPNHVNKDEVDRCRGLTRVVGHVVHLLYRVHVLGLQSCAARSLYAT